VKYKVDYSKEAEDDLNELDNAQENQVRKAILKVSENPLPKSEGGYGAPLGNKHGKNLTGLCKIKLLKLGIRVVYRVIKIDNVMRIVVIAARTDDEVYEIASKRIK